MAVDMAHLAEQLNPILEVHSLNPAIFYIEHLFTVNRIEK